MGDVTAINALRYPELTDPPNAESGFQNLANDLDTRIIPRFASTGARDTAIPSPVEGMCCSVNGVGFQRHDGSDWATIGASTTTYVSKSADESVTSSTSFQDDNELFLPVATNSFYDYKFVLLVSSAGTAGDIKIDVTYPATGATLMLGAHGGQYTNSSSIDAAYMTVVGRTGTSGTIFNNNFYDANNNDPGTIIMLGTLLTTSTAGTLKLRWAQMTSSVSATTVLAGSFLRLDKLG